MNYGKSINKKTASREHSEQFKHITSNWSSLGFFCCCFGFFEVLDVLLGDPQNLTGHGPG